MDDLKEAERIRKIQVKFYVNETELNIIERRAKKFQNRSHFLREVALKKKIILPPRPIDIETAMSLKRIGNNINQIARTLNQSESNIFNRSIKKLLLENVKNLSDKLEETQEKLLLIIYNK